MEALKKFAVLERVTDAELYTRRRKIDLKEKSSKLHIDTCHSAQSDDHADSARNVATGIQLVGEASRKTGNQSGRIVILEAEAKCYRWKREQKYKIQSEPPWRGMKNADQFLPMWQVWEIAEVSRYLFNWWSLPSVPNETGQSIDSMVGYATLECSCVMTKLLEPWRNDRYWSNAETVRWSWKWMPVWSLSSQEMWIDRIPDKDDTGGLRDTIQAVTVSDWKMYMMKNLSADGWLPSRVDITEKLKTGWKEKSAINVLGK